LYTATNDFTLVGYIDSDWARGVDDRRSTSGYVFTFGSGAISWASKKKPIVSLSTIEAKYVVAIAGVCQAIWMRRMLRDLRHDQEGATTIFCDNTSTIALSNNYVFHKRTKHIEIRYFYITDKSKSGEVTIEHCPTKEMIGDYFTKPLAGSLFKKFRNIIQGITDGDMPKYRRAYEKSSAVRRSKEIAITNGRKLANMK
jgi:hypothetical protein